MSCDPESLPRESSSKKISDARLSKTCLDSNEEIYYEKPKNYSNGKQYRQENVCHNNDGNQCISKVSSQKELTHTDLIRRLARGKKKRFFLSLFFA